MSQLIKKHSFDEIFDSQAIFRLVLEAIANPSRIINIKPFAEKLFGDSPAMLALALTLLDNNVSYNTCGNCDLSDEIMSLTLSQIAKVSDADFVFVSNADDLSCVIPEVKFGTLADPHKSATIIIYHNCDSLCEMVLYGPGIDGKKIVSLPTLLKSTLELRNQQYFEYPQGIDLLFLNSAGEMFAIPRLICREVD